MMPRTPRSVNSHQFRISASLAESDRRPEAKLKLNVVLAMTYSHPHLVAGLSSAFIAECIYCMDDAVGIDGCQQSPPFRPRPLGDQIVITSLVRRGQLVWIIRREPYARVDDVPGAEIFQQLCSIE